MDQPDPRRLALLRPSVYAAAPPERVLLPMVTSTLFPQLPRIHRNPFRVAMTVMLTGVIVLSVLRLHGPMVTLVALGVPSLFLLYLWQADLLRDIPIWAVVVAPLLGGVLGVGWVSFTGRLIARSYGISTAAGFVLQALIGVGLAISIGGALLMVLPAVVVRVLMGLSGGRPPTSESLDGFSIGVLGALSFTAAATSARLAPQFVTGVIGKIESRRLLIESVLYGVAVPLTAAAAGGLIGIVLWFRPGKRAADHPGVVRAALMAFTLLVVAIYTAMWVIDASRLPKWPQLALHIAITVIALLAARFCVQLALLHEQPDDFAGQPILCVHCDRVVPDMPFCPGCGASARASSRASRRRRRQSPPRNV
ncbi:MAG: zinc ribbon domain-containing protein [Mycobacterium sp.]|nr:zinc ribbon domain-containing protein [Mycobacterium sp.]